MYNVDLLVCVTRKTGMYMQCMLWLQLIHSTRDQHAARQAWRTSMSIVLSRTPVFYIGMNCLNNPRLDGAIGKIYPSALTLKETNLSDHHVAYLDRQLETEKGKLVISLYDKQDDFPFRVQNYPWIAMSHACLCTRLISANFSVSLAPVIDTRTPGANIT